MEYGVRDYEKNKRCFENRGKLKKGEKDAMQEGN
jgi:hypothetical protein